MSETSEIDTANPGTPGTAAAPPPEPPLTPAEHCADEMLERYGPLTASKLANGNRFAKDAFGARYEAEVAAHGDDSHWISEIVDRAEERDHAQGILGRDPLKLSSLPLLQAAEREIREKNPAAWADPGHPDYKRVNSARDLLFRLMATHRTSPLAPGSLLGRTDAIAEFRERHRDALLHEWHPEHKARHDELAELHRAARGR